MAQGLLRLFPVNQLNFSPLAGGLWPQGGPLLMKKGNGRQDESQSKNESTLQHTPAFHSSTIKGHSAAAFTFWFQRDQEEKENMSNVNRIETSGASMETANHDRLGYSGVRASHAMAQMDHGRMQRYKHIITKVGQEKGVDPAIIAGIISRESRAGNVLQNGWGDYGNAWGLMQIDKRWHNPQGAWNSEEHVRQGTGILVDFIGQIQRKFPSWTSEQQLKGAVAAYNTGDGRVRSYQDVDANTTGKDYSNDVIARAQWYKNNGF